MLLVDICVINQTDKEMMMLGAYHLAEYVLASQELIICWTPQYTSRIWCVMEIATFFRRVCLLRELIDRDVNNETGRIVFLPLWAPPLLAVFSCCVLILSLLFTVSLASGTWFEGVMHVFAPFAVALSVFVILTAGM